MKCVGAVAVDAFLHKGHTLPADQVAKPRVHKNFGYCLPLETVVDVAVRPLLLSSRQDATSADLLGSRETPL